MNTWSIFALVLTAVAVLSGLLLRWLTSGRWRVDRRIRAIRHDESAIDEGQSYVEWQDNVPHISSWLEHSGYLQQMAFQLESAGLNWKPGEYVAAWVVAAVALASIGSMVFGPLLAVVAFFFAVAGGWLLLKNLQARRLRQFEEQLADALTFMASSLRSGYGFLRSLQAIKDEMPAPISIEFGKVCDQTAVGLSVPEALGHLLKRMPLPDLDIVVTAIGIQFEVGGNLAEILEIVAETLRSRQRMHAEVKTLSAEGLLSGVILFFLPIAIAVAVEYTNPSYLTPLFHSPLGHLLLVGAAVLQIIGGIVMKSMVNIGV